ncbi:MAG TPA: DNA polymerase III subunit gamma/tau [Opitutus sp.]|nr:DNA polymerase III subunit gamma/tau [Opitutus sp.]
MSAPWPPALVGTPTVAVLERAIERQRLSHSLLLHGDDLGTLVLVAHAIADRLLNSPAAASAFGPEHHPDCHALRPAGKMRFIKIGEHDRDPGTMREFIRALAVSPSVSRHKIGIVHEADRMNTATANAFLKTLEEPPPHTTLLLLTTRPYALLPTIRSRTLHFRIPANATSVEAEGWPEWLAGYRAWLTRLAAGVGSDKREVADHVFTIYGLVARFGAVLDRAVESVWKQQKESLPAELDDD